MRPLGSLAPGPKEAKKTEEAKETKEPTETLSCVLNHFWVPWAQDSLKVLKGLTKALAKIALGKEAKGRGKRQKDRPG